MNNRPSKSKISKLSTSYFAKHQNGTYSVPEYESNHEAILRLCDNIFFMTQDSITLEKKSLEHECKD